MNASLRARLARFAAIAAVALAAISAPAVAGARERPAVSPYQETATLLDSHQLVSDSGGAPAHPGEIDESRPISGAATVLPVLGHATTAAGERLLRVLVPGRPNGAEGWIEERGTVPDATGWSIVVQIASRRVLVYSEGELVRSFRAIVGKHATPTPRGSFFIEENIRMRPGSAGAPYALALSARSDVLKQFEGGPGQIALHGVTNLTGKLGSAASHGCVRLGNRRITWLAKRVDLGAPVLITH